MLCDSCGDKPASVFFKAQVQNQTTKLNLCQSCAKEKGLQNGLEGALGMDLTQLVSGFMQDFQEDLAKSFKVSSRPTQTRCPKCGTLFSSFRSSGFAGCASCYEAFYPAMKEIIRRIHGSSAHTGKTYAPSGQPAGEAGGDEMARLKRELDRAVKQENFEEAALIQKKLRAIENKGR